MKFNVQKCIDAVKTRTKGGADALITLVLADIYPERMKAKQLSKKINMRISTTDYALRRLVDSGVIIYEEVVFERKKATDAFYPARFYTLSEKTVKEIE